VRASSEEKEVKPASRPDERDRTNEFELGVRPRKLERRKSAFAAPHSPLLLVERSKRDFILLSPKLAR